MSRENNTYDAETFPHGLRCIECSHLFIEGEKYAERVGGMTDFLGEACFITEIVCEACDLKAAMA